MFSWPDPAAGSATASAAACDVLDDELEDDDESLGELLSLPLDDDESTSLPSLAFVFLAGDFRCRFTVRLAVELSKCLSEWVLVDIVGTVFARPALHGDFARIELLCSIAHEACSAKQVVTFRYGTQWKGLPHFQAHSTHWCCLRGVNTLK